MKNKLDIKSLILTAINGSLIGVANIIPGVSGGTFALILGIFDRMVNAIDSISLNTVKVILNLFVKLFNKNSRDEFIEEFKKIDAVFLIILGLFAAISVSALTFLMEYLLAEKTSLTLAFFVGLIVPSIIVPFSMMEKKGWRLLLIIPGALLTGGLTSVMPDNAGGADNPLIALLSGAIAISAMILPGISGSFVLLVMGQYQNFIAKLSGFMSGISEGSFNISEFFWLAAFGVGLAVGLLAFTKLLALLLKKAKSATMGFLIGLILGSLFVLWPFKDVDAGAKVVGRDGEVKQNIQIATAKNVMPKDSNEALMAAIALLLGFAGSAAMMKMGKSEHKEQDDK